MCKNSGVVWLDIVRYVDSTQTHVILLSKTKVTIPSGMYGEKIVREKTAIKSADFSYCSKPFASSPVFNFLSLPILDITNASSVSSF